MVRRNFMKQSMAAGIALSTTSISSILKPKRKFRICLNPGAIGVKGDMHQILEYAVKYGYEGIVPNGTEIHDMKKEDRNLLVSKMKENKIAFGAAGLPLDFRKDQISFEKGLTYLAKIAGTLEEVGVTRMSTWIMPTHDTLTYMENLKQHGRRLQKVANILGHHNIKFGLEYVGPKTLMARDRYPFVSSMKEGIELLDAIGESNVGFVLDSFHWYCAQESVADILSLDKDQIVTVDLNDAIEGRNEYEQLDWERMLPGDSGVIDLEGFIGALKIIGYDGPVRAEPFNQELKDMNDEEAVEVTYRAMKETCDL